MATESQLIQRALARAAQLTNGHRGDLNLISEQLADLTVIVVDLQNNGCGRQCKTFGWPAAVTTITTTVAVLGYLAVAMG